MKTVDFLIFCLMGCLIIACDKNKPVPSIPEKKSSFQKTVFTHPQSGSTLTLISETECEIDNRENILLAEYSRQENKLRVVIRNGGIASVSYFDLLPDGLRAPDSGEVFLLPEPLNKVREQIRLAREAETRAIETKRDAEAGITTQIRTFFLDSEGGKTKLVITDGSLETADRKLYFADVKSLRAWDDETVIINNTDRYRCKNQGERDEVIREIKAAYGAWALRFPDSSREKPF